MTNRQATAATLNRAGMDLIKVGDSAGAELKFRAALAADPDHPVAHHALGLMALNRGDAAAAIPFLQRGTELDPSNPAGFINLGVALRRMERFAEALLACDRALALDERSASVRNNRGNILRELGRLPDALADYECAINLDPGYAEAHHNRGVLLQKLGRLDDALAALVEAVRLRPEYAEAHVSRGNVLRDLGRWDEAVDAYALAIQSADGKSSSAAVDAHYNRAAVLRDQGDAEGAAADLRAALELRPGFHQARWALAFSGLTPVYNDVASLTMARERFPPELQALRTACHAEPGGLGGWEPAVGSAQPFYAAYHGFNERETLSEYGALCCAVMAAWKSARNLPPLRTPASRTHRRVRVGFVSAHIHRHSVWDVLTRGWLTQLDRKSFETCCYHVGWRRDRETAVARQAAEHFVMGGRPLDFWLDRITRDAPDVLIYPEIGMDPMTAKLASLRLAPVQCVAWGHPITSGLPTMDHFLSADLLEPDGAEQHYTERLIRLPGLGCYFEPLGTSPATVDSGQQQSMEGPLKPDAPVSGEPVADEDAAAGPRLVCCQQVAKYHPAHDALYVRIARELGRCRFTFVELARTHGAWERFRRRLEGAFRESGLDPTVFLHFIPTLPRREFLELLGRHDAYLDTPSFSGFTTAIQALRCDGLPVVTLAGGLLRNRLAAGVLRHIGVTDTVAGSLDDYVHIALRVASDADWRATLRRRLGTALERAYRDRSAIEGLEAFLLATAGRTSRPA